MGKARYSSMNEASAVGFLISALGEKDGDGDTGNSFPRSDAEDMSKGARFIPGEVTMARRRGQKVQFETECGPNCWYWKMPDGSRIYHVDPLIYEDIALANGQKKVKGKHGERYETAGPCPHCGNIHTSGGTIDAPAQK